MATVMTDNNYYTEIAEVIRTKNGLDTQYKPSEMANAIRELQPETVVNFIQIYSGVGDYLFYKYNKLISAQTLAEIGTSSFEGCNRLTFIRAQTCPSIGVNAFKDCFNLDTVILTENNSVMCVIDETAFLNTPIGDKTGYIYIPSDRVAVYEEAYPSYAFRASEDYPEITEVS